MKKMPERSCAICRTKKLKSQLIRLVNDKNDGLIVDASGKLNGRGAYICANETCLMEKKARKQLAEALKMDISESEFIELQNKIINQLEFLKRTQKTKQ